MTRRKKSSQPQSPSPSLQTVLTAPESSVVAGVCSVPPVAASPDPRWPYLNRWSGGKSFTATSAKSERFETKDLTPAKASSPAPDTSPVSDPVTPAVVLHPSLEVKETGEQVLTDNDTHFSGNSAPASQASLAEIPSADHIEGAAPEAVVPQPDSANRGKKLVENCSAPPLKVASPIEAFALNTNPSKELVNPPMRQGPSPQPQRLLGAWNKKLNLLPQRETQVSQKPDLEMEDPIRFPWAARMNPASRNLFRAIEPEYLEDGTPKVTIPSHVFLKGLENQKEYVLGQFFRCSLPPGGLVYAVLNNLWGRDCKITIRKLGESSYLFHIPNESTRTWVLQRGLWHVDDCLMFVAPWSPGPSLAIPEIKTIPMWVTLKRIPNALYSIPGISHIASGLGAPIKTHKPRLDPILMGEAKILVEVELNKAFPPRIAASDDSGFISMVDVEYPWLPSTCGRCGQLGHKVKRCLQAGSDSAVVDHTTTTAPVIDDTAVCNEVTEPQVESATVNVIEGTPSGPVTTAPLPATIVTVPNLVIPTSCTPQASSPAATTNEKVIESLISGTARPLSATKDTIAQEHSSSHFGRESSIEPDFGSNRFASLGSPEEEEDSSDSDQASELTDPLTPAGKRILRDRPVKPTAKAKEMHWQSSARGRGQRGRGGRGRHRTEEQEEGVSKYVKKEAESNGGRKYKRKLEEAVTVPRDFGGSSSSTVAGFTVIKSSYLRLLAIKHSFAEDHMPRTRATFKIHHPDEEKSWSVGYLPRYDPCVPGRWCPCFSAGWGILVREYPLAIGDICTFTLIKPDEMLLVVRKP